MVGIDANLRSLTHLCPEDSIPLSLQVFDWHLNKIEIEIAH